MSKETKEIIDQVFWLDGFEGECSGGYFIRNDLKEFFNKLIASGKTPVGIKYDGSFNLEIIVKEND